MLFVAAIDYLLSFNHRLEANEVISPVRAALEKKIDSLFWLKQIKTIIAFMYISEIVELRIKSKIPLFIWDCYTKNLRITTVSSVGSRELFTTATKR